MAKQYPADTVGKDGKVYPTVGENIRNAVNIDTLINVTNTENRVRVNLSLHTSSKTLKSAIVELLTGKDAYFGGDTSKLTAEEITKIKNFLGISQAKE